MINGGYLAEILGVSFVWAIYRRDAYVVVVTLLFPRIHVTFVATTTLATTSVVST